MKIIPIESRDSFGQYIIGPGETHVFPFTFEFLGGLTIQSRHIQLNSQDFSLDLWVSGSPLDDLLLTRGLGHIKLSRVHDDRLIRDELLKPSPDHEGLYLPSGITYYVNVKNLENRQNAYELNLDPWTPDP